MASSLTSDFFLMAARFLTVSSSTSVLLCLSLYKIINNNVHLISLSLIVGKNLDFPNCRIKANKSLFCLASKRES